MNGATAARSPRGFPPRYTVIIWDFTESRSDYGDIERLRARLRVTVGWGEMRGRAKLSTSRGPRNKLEVDCGCFPSVHTASEWISGHKSTHAIQTRAAGFGACEWSEAGRSVLLCKRVDSVAESWSRDRLECFEAAAAAAGGRNDRLLSGEEANYSAGRGTVCFSPTVRM